MRRLTITVSDEFYDGVRRRAGRQGVGRYLENLTRDHVVPNSLAAHYRDAQAEISSELEAEAWIEAESGDTLPDEDWSWLRDAEGRGLVGRL